jgi:hypothetical protein
LKTSPQRPLFASARLPSMKCWMSAMSLYPQQDSRPTGIISRPRARGQRGFYRPVMAE